QRLHGVVVGAHLVLPQSGSWWSLEFDPSLQGLDESEFGGGKRLPGIAAQSEWHAWFTRQSTDNAARGVAAAAGPLVRAVPRWVQAGNRRIVGPDGFVLAFPPARPVWCAARPARASRTAFVNAVGSPSAPNAVSPGRVEKITGASRNSRCTVGWA